MDAPLEVRFKWAGLDASADAAAQLGPRCLAPVCGALALLVADEEDRAALRIVPRGPRAARPS